MYTRKRAWASRLRHAHPLTIATSASSVHVEVMMLSLILADDDEPRTCPFRVRIRRSSAITASDKRRGPALRLALVNWTFSAQKFELKLQIGVSEIAVQGPSHHHESFSFHTFKFISLS